MIYGVANFNTFNELSYLIGLPKDGTNRGDFALIVALDGRKVGLNCVNCAYSENFEYADL